MEKRTVIKFHYNGNIWPIIEQWVLEHELNLESSGENERTYQGGSSIFGTQIVIKVISNNYGTVLEAWVPFGFQRLLNPLLIPAEMALESGGITGVQQRRNARKMVNKLLEKLGQPLIQ